MKNVMKSAVAGACGAALVAGSVLSAPMAGAQSGVLPSGSLGEQCDSVQSDATLEIPEDSTSGDVASRTGGVPADKGLVRVDGWGGPEKVYTRFGFATGTELTNVTLTLKLDDALGEVGEASIETPGAANVDEVFTDALDGGTDKIVEEFDEDTNTATVTIDKVNANSSLSLTYAARPDADTEKVTNSMTVTADNLGEAGFCGGIVGSIDDSLGSLPGGSLGNGSVANLVGSLSSISADSEEEPEESATT